MAELKTLQIAVYGAFAGAVAGALVLLVHPGQNDVSLLWIWIAMAALSAIMGAALASALSGAWNFYVRRPSQ